MLLRFIPANDTFVIITTDDHAAHKIVIDKTSSETKTALFENGGGTAGNGSTTKYVIAL